MWKWNDFYFGQIMSDFNYLFIHQFWQTLKMDYPSVWKWLIHFFIHRSNYSLFFWVNCFNLSACLVTTFVQFSNGFLTIIGDHGWWSLTRNRKQKNISNFWPKKWSQSFKKFSSTRLWERVFKTVFNWETKQSFTKWLLYRRWPLTQRGRFDYIS